MGAETDRCVAMVREWKEEYLKAKINASRRGHSVDAQLFGDLAVDFEALAAEMEAMSKVWDAQAQRVVR